MNALGQRQLALSPAGGIPNSEIDFSCRLPLLVMFVSAAVWLVIASFFGLISSIKFHSPDFLAGVATLTYGRVRPAFVNSLLYGFALQAGLGVSLWLLVRLGRNTLVQRFFVTIGASLWNLGVTIGVLAILAGDSTGFENLEMPFYAVLLIFMGYLVIGVCAVLTLHERRERPLFVSQWFVLTGLFWFPWIYSTANLLLLKFPVRGVAQAVIAWWYGQNLLWVWLALVGLGTVFYFIPKLLNRELHSHYLALFTFWMLILFASWGGIPNSAPVPAWIPTLSTIGTVLTVIPFLAVALNVHRTVAGSYSILRADPALLFIAFGAGAFLLAGLMRILGMVLDVNQQLRFTWFAPATDLCNTYGFFAMVMFGAIYRILPHLTGTEFPFPRLVPAHFWVAAAGVILSVFPLAAGGVVQALELQNPNVPFTEIVKSTLPVLRSSTVGDLLLFVGHLLFLGNAAGLLVRFYRSRAVAAYSDMTADLFKTAGAKP
jgi:cytochrome c oxidase cbb3-type subunit 1